jgi:signal transduction histidine kinase/CheY-like chemotaxis protein
MDFAGDTQPDARIAARIRLVSRVAASAAAGLGVVALASYRLDEPWLRTFGHATEVQPNAAAGTAILATAVVLLGLTSPAARWAARGAAAVAGLVGAATLLEHLLGVDLFIDRILIPDVAFSPGVVSPGRMGPPAALNLLVGGIALQLLTWHRRGRAFAGQTLALGVVPVALLGLVGHAYDVAALYGHAAYSAVALPAALALFLIDVALLCARPDRGFVRHVAGAGTGSSFARRMLVYVVVVPSALGALTLVVTRGGADAALAVSMLVVVLSLVFAILVLRDAKTLDRMEAAKERAQAERAASREELARALRREQEARAQAEAASHAKDQFLATLSHELRTPLNAIVGWSGLLRGAAGDPDRLARGLAVIDRNGRSLARLVADLLDMSRIASGAVEVQRVDVDLLAAVDITIEELRPVACAKGVALARIAGPTRPHVVGDAARLRQVASNLVSNAVKFTPPGGTVSVQVSEDGGRAVLEVQDTGIGMSAEFLPIVFDAFVQADGGSMRRHGGLGLGLAITRQLVELHGGTISAASEGPGRGATFRVTFPAVRRRVTPVAATAAKLERPDLHGAAILVVDDEPDSRDVLLQLLASWGARASGAASAREAREALAHARPDLVISDVAMPEEDGYAFVRELRREERARAAPPLPVVALTAFARAEDREHALAAGFDAHVAKPVEPAALLATIAGMLRKAPPQAQAQAQAQSLGAGARAGVESVAEAG